VKALMSAGPVYSGMYLPPDSLPIVLVAAQSLACSGQPAS